MARVLRRLSGSLRPVYLNVLVEQDIADGNFGEEKCGEKSSGTGFKSLLSIVKVTLEIFRPPGFDSQRTSGRVERLVAAAIPLSPIN